MFDEGAAGRAGKVRPPFSQWQQRSHGNGYPAGEAAAAILTEGKARFFQEKPRAAGTAALTGAAAAPGALPVCLETQLAPLIN